LCSTPELHPHPAAAGRPAALVILARKAGFARLALAAGGLHRAAVMAPPLTPEELFARLDALGIAHRTYSPRQSSPLPRRRRCAAALVNDRTTAVAPRDLLRFIAACGHTPQIIDLVLDHYLSRLIFVGCKSFRRAVETPTLGKWRCWRARSPSRSAH
jgi:hypothetical protein